MCRLFVQESTVRVHCNSRFDSVPSELCRNARESVLLFMPDYQKIYFRRIGGQLSLVVTGVQLQLRSGLLQE